MLLFKQSHYTQEVIGSIRTSNGWIRIILQHNFRNISGLRTKMKLVLHKNIVHLKDKPKVLR